MVIFFYGSYVLSGILILPIIIEKLSIYFTPLLAITGAILILRSKKIFYTLCNMLTQKKICIEHKGHIKEKTYICLVCLTKYCERCYNALKVNNDSCWYCKYKF